MISSIGSQRYLQPLSGERAMTVSQHRKCSGSSVLVRLKKETILTQLMLLS